MRRVVGDADGSAGTRVKARCRWSFGLRLRLSAGLCSARQLDKRLKKKKLGCCQNEGKAEAAQQNGSSRFIMSDLTWIM